MRLNKTKPVSKRNSRSNLARGVRLQESSSCSSTSMRKWVLGGCLCVASGSNPCDEAIAAAKIIDVDAAQRHLAVARQHALPCVADVGAWALRVAQAGQRAVEQGDARRAPPLLGAAWALAPIDESLTAKYITALGVADAPERTAKDALPDRAARVLDDAMARGVWRDPLQRPGEFDAALPSLGGWPEASPPVRACIADLERAYAENGAAFRAEALALLEARGYEQHEGLQDPAKPKWSYADVDDSTLEVSRPTIDRAVAAVRRTCGLQAAGISRLEPGAAIRPHTGPTNRRWTLHLGLVVDAADVDRLTLTVAGTARAGAWVQGKVVLFDDSYEHDVVHAGARDRVVLDLSIDHPALRARSGKPQSEL